MELPERYEVRCLLTRSNRFPAPGGIEYVGVRSVRDLMPSGPLGELATGLIGDRYVRADEAFAWADIVHAEELSFWFAAEAARQRRRHGFRLVQTVWETLPMLDAFRNRQARANRRLVLEQTDLFLAATERAALALELEGVPESRIAVCSPGIDTARFSAARAAPASEHVIVSPGRLVWEKGHQDVIRALALLHRGIVRGEDPQPMRPRLQIIGSGPELGRLRAHAEELGVGGAVEIGAVPYDQMPSRFAAASAMVLATQAMAAAGRHPFDIPRVFWEEQFGMVLAEAMAAGLAIVTTTSGAVPEVLSGAGAQLVAPGDWIGIARALAAGPLRRPPGERVSYPPELVSRYSTSAAADRLAAAYDRLTGPAG